MGPRKSTMQFMPYIQQTTSTGAAAASAGVSSAKTAATGFADLLDGVVAKDAVRPVLFRGTGSEEANYGIWDEAHSGAKGFASQASAGRFASVLDGKNTKGTAKKDGTDVVSRLIAYKAGKSEGKSGLKDVINLKMTREDFAALKKDLRKAGLSEEELKSLSDKIDSEGGLTWGAFVAVLSERVGSLGNIGSVNISATQERDLLSFFGKLGFQPGEASGLVEELKAGNTSKVWEAVGSKLASLPADATIELTSGELSALSSVVKLSSEGSARLAALLGGANQATVSPSQLATVLNALTNEITADVSNAALSARNLFDTVEEALADATSRSATSTRADARFDNDARTNRILSDAQRRERAREEAAENGAKSADSKADKGHAARVLDETPPTNAARLATQVAAAQGEAKQSKTAKTAEERTKNPEATAEGKDAAKTEKAATEARLSSKGLADGKDAKSDSKGGKNAMAEGKSDGAKAFDALMSKVRVQAASATDARADLAAAAQTAQPQATDLNALGETVARMNQNVPSRMMEQVQSGVLKNLGQGTKQLTLQLEPAELGRLHMVMQSKDGEVSIMLRAETKDAGNMLTEQLSHLRTQLEQQGVKVARMEVQTQLQGQNQGNAWYGENQHNMSQEQKNFIERRGIWRMLRNEGMSVAQEMQIDPQTAGIARDGLYVVA